MAKPDNRADNVRKLQENVQNTLKNLDEAEEYLDEHADEISTTELNDIKQKNANRRESIAGFREEIKDEAAHQRQQ
ncbi:small acid-soluble spore protein Tlp [Gorillibacterium sp. sgz5001074]|uniref:small acid-soluble spore protein Tlp n=1 Tax=Gorillibacterium sp. sgz5001074 TaxID=3446695 RepID=UPI003F665A62